VAYSPEHTENGMKNVFFGIEPPWSFHCAPFRFLFHYPQKPKRGKCIKIHQKGGVQAGKPKKSDFRPKSSTRELAYKISGLRALFFQNSAKFLYPALAIQSESAKLKTWETSPIMK